MHVIFSTGVISNLRWKHWQILTNAQLCCIFLAVIMKWSKCRCFGTVSFNIACIHETKTVIICQRCATVMAKLKTCLILVSWKCFSDRAQMFMLLLYAESQISIANNQPLETYWHETHNLKLKIYRKKNKNLKGLLLIFNYLPFYVLTIFVFYGDFERTGEGGTSELHNN